MKRYIYILLKLLVLFALLFVIPGCWDRWELDELAIQLGTAIDKVGNDYRVSPTTTVSIEEIIKQFVTENLNPVLTGVQILGDKRKGEGLSNIREIESAAQIHFMGLAVFRKDKLIGWLNDTDSRGYSYIKKTSRSSSRMRDPHILTGFKGHGRRSSDVIQPYEPGLICRLVLIALMEIVAVQEGCSRKKRGKNKQADCGLAVGHLHSSVFIAKYSTGLGHLIDTA